MKRKLSVLIFIDSLGEADEEQVRKTRIHPNKYSLTFGLVHVLVENDCIDRVGIDS